MTHLSSKRFRRTPLKFISILFIVVLGLQWMGGPIDTYAQASAQLILDINKTLRKNRKILKQFNPEGKTTIRTEYLVKLGFDFRYHTHSYTTKNNNNYRFCYEYGYLRIEDDKTLIVNWQPYMES